jgi:hypothetical protein
MLSQLLILFRPIPTKYCSSMVGPSPAKRRRHPSLVPLVNEVETTAESTPAQFSIDNLNASGSSITSSKRTRSFGFVVSSHLSTCRLHKAAYFKSHSLHCLTQSWWSQNHSTAVSASSTILPTQAQLEDWNVSTAKPFVVTWILFGVPLKT